MLTELDHQGKVRKISSDLLCMARARGAGIKLPTVQEMCAGMGVTRTQLDQALLSLENGGFIRRRRGSGIYGTERVSQKTLGVVFGGDIFSSGFSPFWGLLLQAVREETADSRLVPRAYLDIGQSSGGFGGHAQLIEDLEERRLDGLLLLSPQSEHDEAAELRAYGVPVVVFGGQASMDWSVVPDWTPLSTFAAENLVRQDCRRIGLLGSPAHGPIFQEALRQAGGADFRIDDWSYETWANIIPGAGTRENCAHQLTQRMIADRGMTPLPDAVVSFEDTATRGMITALLQAGLRPGRDIRMITAENKGSPVLEPYAASITRVAIDPCDCVKAALGMLETLMNGGTPEQNPVRVRAGMAGRVEAGAITGQPIEKQV